MAARRENYWLELRLLYQHIENLLRSDELLRIAFSRKHHQRGTTESASWCAGYLAALEDVLEMLGETVVNKKNRTALTGVAEQHESTKRDRPSNTIDN
jgi:hypothetical protein